MKKIYFLLFLLTITLAAQAQPTRLTGTNYFLHNGFAFMPQDTNTYTYYSGNMQISNAEDYFFNRVKSDEKLTVVHNSGIGYYTASKMLYEYDANWNVIKETWQMAPSPGAQIQDAYQYLTDYNANGDEVLKLMLNINPITQMWDTVTRTTTTYDASGNMIKKEVEFKNSGSWGGQFRQSYDYDANNNNTLYVTETWNFMTNQYDSNTRISYYYTAGNMIDTQVQESYNVGASMWENSDKSITVYNSSNLPELNITQFWQNNAWENSEQDEMHYNAQSELVYTDKRTWSGGMWENWYRDTLVVTSTTPKMEELIHKVWDAGTGMYENATRIRRTYNANDQMTLMVDDNWKAATNTWAPGNNCDSFIFHYAAVVSAGNIAAAAPEVKVYPNPATNYVQIDAGAQTQPYTITIHDMAGRAVAQQRVNAGRDNIVVPVAHLSAGQYILSIKTAQGKTATPITVVR